MRLYSNSIVWKQLVSLRNKLSQDEYSKSNMIVNNEDYIWKFTS